MRSSIARTALAGLVALSLITSVGARAATNLVFNPGFEQSLTDPTGDTTNQPMLPTGWVFEGAAALFDHNQSSGYPAHSGRRMAAISAPLSGKRTECQQGQCVDSPLNVVKDNTAKYYSITPYWRVLTPIAVSAGHSYALSVWASYAVATANVGGAITKVRWTDIMGAPISESNGPKNIATANASDIGWTLLSSGTHPLVAPAGATGATIMLGAADDEFISQIRFDDVDFHQV